MIKKNINNDSLSFWTKKVMTYKDYGRIFNLISEDVGKSHIPASSLHRLYLLVMLSKKYSNKDIPKNAVTLNSELVITNNEFQKQLVRIVLPQDMIGKHDISLYNILAIACLGAMEKDDIVVDFNKSIQRFHIEKVAFHSDSNKLFHI
ncbi:hypothetical protein [Carboxylicivirga caseinilyticus]|uniref:hypothetical protein n=1 Tax=Carboxylicivirga caseinilyticus TaxID=3417572 RepID=UPI003D351692|nr:hypothetical protein [Marinilabiliaceae bacterium A049]